MIPARGGSQELRRKNLLPDANGVPLVLASARAARDAGCYVIVSTDDAEVASLATIDGHLVHNRGSDFADVPVDEVVVAVCQWLSDQDAYPTFPFDAVLLVQPTVQPITAELLQWFIQVANGDHPVFPDIDGRTPIALGVEDRHIMWGRADSIHGDREGYELFAERSERQAMPNPPIREMGVRWWPDAKGVQHPPATVITWLHPLVDIDTAADYQQIARRLRIGFLVWANKQVGTGHIRRALTLAEGLQHHDVTIGLTKDSDQWAFDLVEERGFSVAGRQEVGDVAVYDRLDSVAGWKGPMEPFVVFEDRGPGASQAAAVINAMYDPYPWGRSKIGNEYHGAKYAVLRPEFTIGDYTVKNGPDLDYDPDLSSVMILFGGTDPGNLAGLAVHALTGADLAFTEFAPGDDISVAAAMHKHDLLITSGGRTVFEAAAVGIPTIVLCQNMRETTHTHLGKGNINLGLGRMVEPDRLRYVVEQTLGDYELRRDMSSEARASIDGLGAARVRRIIEHVGLYGEAP